MVSEEHVSVGCRIRYSEHQGAEIAECSPTVNPDDRPGGKYGQGGRMQNHVFSMCLLRLPAAKSQPT